MKSSKFQSLKRKYGKPLLLLTAVFLFLCAAAWAFWEWIMPRLCPVPENAFDHLTGATVYFDRTGAPAHCRRGYDHRFAFYTPLSDLPQHLIDVTIAAEDRHFRAHSGVDLRAVLRAANQLVRNGRIVSGASTITMQLMGMREEKASKTRSFRDKFRQAAEARNFERTHSKDEILELYFNTLPYGGKIYGIEAAAQYYFGRSAKDLNLAESILLCGLPQAPSRYRPDRHPERAWRRFWLIVTMLEDQGYFTHEQAQAVLAQKLRFRDFSVPFYPAAKDPQYFECIPRPGRRESWRVETALDPVLTRSAHQMLTQALQNVNGVRDGAMVVIENATHKVRVMIGTLDFSRKPDGEFNAAKALRSPGSALKPFLFGEALYGGLLIPETILDDSPVSYAGYSPGNFSGTFLGRVRADRALAMSLNTPAVRLLRDLGVHRMQKQMVRFGIFSTEREERDIGLSLALGGRETDLLSLTNAYAGLTKNELKKCTFLEHQAESAAEKMWQNDAVPQALLEMMCLFPLTNAGTFPVAWKTGTSSNSRDAWCFALTPQYTVGVWFGNKNSAPSAQLIGAKLAAPVAGQMIARLFPVPGAFWSNPACFEIAEICMETGLRAGPQCKNRKLGKTIRDIPLKMCTSCGKEPRKAGKKTVILNPTGTTCQARNGTAKWVLKCNPETVHYYCNGSYEGTLKNGSEFVLKPGVYCLTFWGGNGYENTELQLTVLPEE